MAMKTALRSVAGMDQGSRMAGIQLLIMSGTADPLNKASGVRVTISSMAVMGKTGNSPFGGRLSVPSG
jgi:hypothetical protein